VTGYVNPSMVGRFLKIENADGRNRMGIPAGWRTGNSQKSSRRQVSSGVRFGKSKYSRCSKWKERSIFVNACTPGKSAYMYACLTRVADN